MVNVIMWWTSARIQEVLKASAIVHHLDCASKYVIDTIEDFANFLGISIKNKEALTSNNKHANSIYNMWLLISLIHD